MKYIISESRFKEYMKSYLESWVSTKHVNTHHDFILIQQPAEGDENWDDYMEYDFTDGRLWVNRNFLYMFMSPFPFKDATEAQMFIKDWFENKFNVEVNFVES